MPDSIDGMLPDDAVWVERLRELAYPHIEAAVRRGARSAAQRYGIELTWDVTNPLVLEWLEHYAGLMAQRVTETVREKLRTVLTEGIAQGTPRRELIRQIRDAMEGEANRRRAELIARTETARAQHAGRIEQLREAGAKRKVWRVNQDACEFCQAIEGMTVEIDESFFRRGDSITLESSGSAEDELQLHTLRLDYEDTPHPPLHPACRCDLEIEWD